MTLRGGAAANLLLKAGKRLRGSKQLDHSVQKGHYILLVNPADDELLNKDWEPAEVTNFLSTVAVYLSTAETAVNGYAIGNAFWKVGSKTLWDRVKNQEFGSDSDIIKATYLTVESILRTVEKANASSMGKGRMARVGSKKKDADEKLEDEESGELNKPEVEDEEAGEPNKPEVEDDGGKNLTRKNGNGGRKSPKLKDDSNGGSSSNGRQNGMKNGSGNGGTKKNGAGGGNRDSNGSQNGKKNGNGNGGTRKNGNGDANGGGGSDAIVPDFPPPPDVPPINPPDIPPFPLDFPIPPIF